MLVVEGLDLYVHERQKCLVLVVHFDFTDGSSDGLHWHKLGVCAELGAGIGRDPLSKKLIWSSSSRSLRSEGKVLNNFLRFVSILIAEFSVGGAVDFAFKMKGDMIIENLDLKPMINAMMRDFLDPSRWKELSKKSGSKILPCGDGSCWKAFKPIASLIA
ncbi:hypothetical protein Tco_0730499 [Tanacetum coccineum]|uniref:Uncharacterized protein n=1 Tax=Tanacetum coccineum TaxID=301880 RepID=A0ABQ4YVF9_9ASTR